MQTITRSRPFGDTLALSFLLVGAGVVTTAITALALAPPPGHTGAMVLSGSLGGLVLLLLASWACSAGAEVLGGLLYFLFCAANGVMLAPLAAAAAHDREFAALVSTAAFATAAIFGVLAVVASWLPRLFIGWGQFLFTGLLVLLATSVVAAFVHASPVQLALDACGILLFCGYVLYDVSAIVSGRHDSAVRGAIELYLDVLNLFIYILDLLLRLFRPSTYFDSYDLGSSLPDGTGSSDSWSLSDLFSFFND